MVSRIIAIAALLAASLIGETTNAVSEFGYRYVFPQSSYVARCPRTYSNCSVTVYKGEYPLVNREVRFTSLDPSLLRFKTGASMIVRTDNRGTAHAVYTAVDAGSTRVIAEVLSPKGDEIAARGIVPVTCYSIRSLALGSTLLHLFVITVTAFLIVFFKRTERGVERTTNSLIGMATLFGFNLIVKRIVLLPVVSFIGIVIVFLIMLPQTTLLATVFLVLLALTSFTIPRDRGYGFLFMFFALIGITWYFRNTVIPLMPAFANAPHALSAWWFTAILFLIFTVFFNGNFFPLLILTFYATFVSLPMGSVISSLAGIFAADMIYVVKTHYKINSWIFFRINFLRIKDKE
ncbi:MAG: hypothetical protein HZC28_03220 [Spirochaetes bacterium]|nr:hypothetical protein [Spirochaetota bacterium]